MYDIRIVQTYFALNRLSSTNVKRKDKAESRVTLKYYYLLENMYNKFYLMLDPLPLCISFIVIGKRFVDTIDHYGSSQGTFCRDKTVEVTL